MNALFAPGAKFTRNLLVVGFALLLAGPAMLLWASKTQTAPVGVDESDGLTPAERYMQAEETRRFLSGPHLIGYERDAKLSPFGQAFHGPKLREGNTAGLLLTNLGHLDPRAPEALLGHLPAHLRLQNGELRALPKGRVAKDGGAHYVILTDEAAAAGTLDASLEALRGKGRILAHLSSDALMIYADRGQIEAIAAMPQVKMVMAREPGDKIATFTGRVRMISAREAQRSDLLIEAYVVPGMNSSVIMDRVRAIPGISEVTAYGVNGAGLLMRAHTPALSQLARFPEIMTIQESLEWNSTNAEAAPILQMGSAREGFNIRPFDAAGVDGGGLNAAGLPSGTRVNNGTAQVPPQIVVVTDNGISYDNPSFSHTATQPVTAFNPIGPSHRKVHSIQNVADGTGFTCDAPLSGAGTHGNVVASTIAAYPSQFGVFASQSGRGGSSLARNQNLDGTARGARIIMQDSADSTRCILNSIVERGGNVLPGSLATRLNAAICPKSGGTGPICTGLIGGADEVHLAVFPFGTPNFAYTTNSIANGTYPQEAADIDTFLYNNRDFMVVAPVGNNGLIIGVNRLALATRVIPDLFNGTALDDNPNNPQGIQITPPATAKNLIAVGAANSDHYTFFGAIGYENYVPAFTSRGPATAASLRMAPIVTAPAFDGFNFFGLNGIAAFRSRDNDNLAPVDAQIDEANAGTSFAAGYVTGAAAILRDYFAQGFYPTASRNPSNRVANLSGAVVKAALAASANFNEYGVGTQGQDDNERDLRRTRAMDVGSPSGVPVGVMGNSEQGYGHVVLTHVLPLANWSNSFQLNQGATAVPFLVAEHPAAGLLVWDDLATGEPLLNNTTNTTKSHLIRVSSPSTAGVCVGGSGAAHCDTVADCAAVGGTSCTQAIMGNELRVALAWPDIPSAALSGGVLINDLDLTLQGPGPDNCLAAGDIAPNGSPCPAGSASDNQAWDGNVYQGGRNNNVTDQWSRARPAGSGEIHDRRNPIEAIHITSDPDASGIDASGYFDDSPLYTGNYRLTVKRGLNADLTVRPLTINTTVSEDTNNNRRLDAGEDTVNVNGLLDLPGQAYALVVSGPVFLAEAAPTGGPSQFPQSSITLDSIRYSCASSMSATIFDTTPGADAARSSQATSFTVVNAAGAVLDSEASIVFTAASTAGSTASAGVPIRLASPAVANNGILEADTGQLVVATYAPAGQAAISASAAVYCAPNLISGFFATAGTNAFGTQYALGGGCDNDESFDAGETVTYGIAVVNYSPTDRYSDVTATLTASGPGAAALKVLDSPKNTGSLPPGQTNSIFFHVYVDPAAIPAGIADRRVTMTLNLDTISKGQRLSQQSYSFDHALNADTETLHYSTDVPGGGRRVRDLNRNLVIDEPNTVDPFRLIVLPDEDVTFASMFVPGNAAGLVTNTLGEDLNNNSVLDAGEDVIPNGQLDRGILATSAAPTLADRAPWSFDRNNGGWAPFRHPDSNATATLPSPVWEYKTGGLCGFQTAAAGVYGIWHTGDGDPATPASNASACDNHALPREPLTPAKVEILFDVLESPIVAKVNQVNDARGFPYSVEFQRLGVNFNMQTNDDYAGGGIMIDNDVDSDVVNCLLCSLVDTYSTRRSGGWTLTTFTFAGGYFDADPAGIDPASSRVRQRTFGPFSNPDGSQNLNGDELGFSGATQNTNPDSASPIPTAPPDYLAFPLSGAPVAGVCSGGTEPGSECQVSADCAGGGTCTLASRSLTGEGPVRNFDSTLIGFEGGFSSPVNGTASPEWANTFPYTSGNAANRWQIGVGFFSIENSTGLADYGFGVDDVVFEWDESHPKDESQFIDGRGPACSRFNQPGTAAGAQCASIAVDRTNLYDCEESVEIVVSDPKKPFASSVEVAVVTDSDSVQFASLRFSVLRPNDKRYTLNAVPGSPGLFRGNVTITGVTNNPGQVFTSAGADSQFIVYYVDPGCDGDADGAAAENDFDNIDGDGIASGTDNCPFTYNPGQEDADLDGVGNLCDTCVLVADPSQADTDGDGVGDACEFDDVDGDGVDNFTDNCPDLYNPGQEVQGGAVRGQACNTNGDLDGDGVVDRLDNCILAPNPAPQLNRDNDSLGDACDGDCQNSTLAFICSNAPAISCVTSSQCPALPAGGVCQSAVRHATGTCSASDDDADADGVNDSIDNCPGISNPTIIPGTDRQLDSDRDGIGDACDPKGSFDDDFDGIPDDLVTFSGSILCRTQPLARFAVLATEYMDLDGDHDIFPDTGETGRLVVKLKNLGSALSGATFVLSTADSDVACIPQPSIVKGNVAANELFTLGSLDIGQPGLTFTASSTLQTVSAGAPARVELCLSAIANETLGVATPVCFNLLADLDTPPGAEQVFTLGPDGLPGTADDGRTLEDFDIDKDGDGLFTVKDTFLTPTGVAAGAVTYGGPSGFYLRGSATGAGLNTVAGIACGGFDEVAQGNSSCILDPDYPMDWHLHCIPGATNCPNVESGACVGGCSYGTPVNGRKAISCPDSANGPCNSMHMGAHFDANSFNVGDTTHFRAIEGFVTSPINLALFPREGDLEMSFFHIARLMDNNHVGPGNAGQCVDCGDVQLQVDQNPDPAVDEWGIWDKLAPFQNVYDHKPNAWSVFGGYYCLLTPTDTGSAPPAPRGKHETLCFPLGAWSHCGSHNGTSTATTFQCPGPGFLDPSGVGVWVETKFNLAGFLGQRVRIRWIGTTWVFDEPSSSYFEVGGGWDTTSGDDGWWLDNVSITGTLEAQVTPSPDDKTPVTPSCPVGCNPGVGDQGTAPTLKATDTAGNLINGTTVVAIAGQAIRISAVDSTIPGACVGGAPQFQFFKNGALVQDWSSKTLFLDSPTQDASYRVQVRCSSDTICTSQTGASINLPVYSGDGADVSLSVTHNRTTSTTSLSWPTRPQPSSLSGYNVYRGSVPPPDTALSTLTTLSCGVAQGTVGGTQTVNTTDTPVVGTAHYYVAGHRSLTAGARSSLGRTSSGSVRVASLDCP